MYGLQKIPLTYLYRLNLTYLILLSLFLFDPPIHTNKQKTGVLHSFVKVFRLKLLKEVEQMTVIESLLTSYEASNIFKACGKVATN